MTLVSSLLLYKQKSKKTAALLNNTILPISNDDYDNNISARIIEKGGTKIKEIAGADMKGIEKGQKILSLNIVFKNNEVETNRYMQIILQNNHEYGEIISLEIHGEPNNHIKFKKIDNQQQKIDDAIIFVSVNPIQNDYSLHDTITDHRKLIQLHSANSDDLNNERILDLTDYIHTDERISWVTLPVKDNKIKLNSFSFDELRGAIHP